MTVTIGEEKLQTMYDTLQDGDDLPNKVDPETIVAERKAELEDVQESVSRGSLEEQSASIRHSIAQAFAENYEHDRSRIDISDLALYVHLCTDVQLNNSAKHHL